MIDGVRHHTSSDYLLWSRLKLTKYWPLSLKRICIGSCILVTASAGCCLARPRLPLLRSGSDCICAAEVRAARAGAGAGCRLWLPLTIFISPATQLKVVTVFYWNLTLDGLFTCAICSASQMRDGNKYNKMVLWK